MAFCAAANARRSGYSTVRIFCLQLLAALCAVGAAAGAPPETGRILCAYWREIPGTQVDDLTGQASFPDYPNEQVYLEQFEIPRNQEGNYGTMIRGYVHPPMDGAYTFYIAGNNQAELWLSGDAKAQGKQRLASVPQWTMPRVWQGVAQQQSSPVQLKANGVYYVEVRHKNGGGDNHLAVAWRWPDGTMEGPIAGKWLSPAKPVDVPAPKVKWEALPAVAGVFEVKTEVNYLNQVFPLSVMIRVPENGNRRHPVVVYLPDAQSEAGLPATRPAGEHGDFIEIMPRLTQEQSYEQRATIKAICAVVEDLCARQFPVERTHVGLIGVNAGGTAAWKMAAEMPGFYRGIAVIGGGEVRDGRLVERLRQTRVRIITDVAEGMATESANRMYARLAGADPKPQIVYLADKELGQRNAAEYCLGEAALYDFAMGYEKPATGAMGDAGAPGPRWGRAAMAAGVLAALTGAAIYWRVRKEHATR